MNHQSVNPHHATAHLLFRVPDEGAAGVPARDFDLGGPASIRDAERRDFANAGMRARVNNTLIRVVSTRVAA